MVYGKTSTPTEDPIIDANGRQSSHKGRLGTTTWSRILRQLGWYAIGSTKQQQIRRACKVGFMAYQIVGTTWLAINYEVLIEAYQQALTLIQGGK